VSDHNRKVPVSAGLRLTIRHVHGYAFFGWESGRKNIGGEDASPMKALANLATYLDEVGLLDQFDIISLAAGVLEDAVKLAPRTSSGEVRQ